MNHKAKVEKKNRKREREREAYDKINARVIGAPEDFVIDNDEVSGNSIAFVEYVLVHAFDVVYRHR